MAVPYDAEPFIPPDPSPGSGASSAGSAAAAAAGGGGVGEMLNEVTLQIVAANRARNAEPLIVPRGASVEVWPNPNNVGDVQIARSYSEVQNAPPAAIFKPASTGRRYSGVRSLGEFWIKGANVGDYVFLRVVK